MANKKYKTKSISILTPEICKELGIINCIGFEVVQSLGLVVHTRKHMNEFASVDSFNRTMYEISKIVNNPDFYLYDSVKNSIKYYKKLIDYVCIIVNITDTYAFVSTVHPIGKKTYKKLKAQNKK